MNGSRGRGRRGTSLRGGRVWSMLAAVAAVVLSWPASGSASTPSKLKQPVVVAQPASTVAPAKVSPYAKAMRQHGQADSGPVKLHSVPPTMRRTRQPSGQHVGQ